MFEEALVYLYASRSELQKCILAVELEKKNKNLSSFRTILSGIDFEISSMENFLGIGQVKRRINKEYPP